MKTINPQFKEAQTNLMTRNMRKTTPGCIVIKYLKTSVKDQTIKAARKKVTGTYRGTKIRLIALLETMQAIRQDEIDKMDTLIT